MFLTCFAIVATYKRINNCRTFRNGPDTGWMWYGGGRLSSWIVITVECQKCRDVECVIDIDLFQPRFASLKTRLCAAPSEEDDSRRNFNEFDSTFCVRIHVKCQFNGAQEPPITSSARRLKSSEIEHYQPALITPPRVSRRPICYGALGSIVLLCNQLLWVFFLSDERHWVMLHNFRWNKSLEQSVTTLAALKMYSEEKRRGEKASLILI